MADRMIQNSARSERQMIAGSGTNQNPLHPGVGLNPYQTGRLPLQLQSGVAMDEVNDIESPGIIISLPPTLAEELALFVPFDLLT